MTLKDLYMAYQESCNCGGFRGSFAEYVISVGVRLDEIVLDSNEPEDKP